RGETRRARRRARRRAFHARRRRHGAREPEAARARARARRRRDVHRTSFGRGASRGVEHRGRLRESRRRQRDERQVDDEQDHGVHGARQAGRAVRYDRGPRLRGRRGAVRAAERSAKLRGEAHRAARRSREARGNGAHRTGADRARAVVGPPSAEAARGLRSAVRGAGGRAMINALVIVTFLSCFLAAFFAKKLSLVSVYFVVLPELLSGIVLLVVIARMIVGKRLELDPKYIVFIVTLLMTMAIGAVVEGVPAGPIVSGIRTYLPALPLLLLGAIYPFKGREIRSQLVVLVALLAVQIPLAVYQRFWQFAHKMHTGDVVTGTVTNSGVLSVVMISGVTLLTVLYLRRKLALLPYLLCTGAMLVPTAVNETKATIVMLPVAMFAPVLLMRRSEQPLRRLVPIVAIFTICGAGFVATYDHLIQNRASGTTLEDFW